MFRCVLERGDHDSDDVTSIIMFEWKTGKPQVIAKGVHKGNFTAMRWFVHSASVCAVATRVRLLPIGHR